MDVSREHIEIVQGAGGPKARIAGHRVLVEHVVGWYITQGWSVEKIVSEIPTITPADVHAALAYYWDHKEELDREWAEKEAWVQEQMHNHTSPFQDAKREHEGRRQRETEQPHEDVKPQHVG
jgi:uncharacterized protein (DUF433 family)